MLVRIREQNRLREELCWEFTLFDATLHRIHDCTPHFPAPSAMLCSLIARYEGTGPIATVVPCSTNGHKCPLVP